MNDQKNQKDENDQEIDAKDLDLNANGNEDLNKYDDQKMHLKKTGNESGNGMNKQNDKQKIILTENQN